MKRPCRTILTLILDSAARWRNLEHAEAKHPLRLAGRSGREGVIAAPTRRSKSPRFIR